MNKKNGSCISFPKKYLPPPPEMTEKQAILFTKGDVMV